MNYKKIALTGGIGSGKSTALKVLERAGYKTLSSDQIVSELYQKRSVKNKLKTLFPTAVKGALFLKIDRAKISAEVFNDKNKHKQLTDLITPLVLDQIKKRTAKLKAHVFVEVPLLFECAYQSEFDGVMVITRTLDARIKSVKSRSNLTEEQVLSRIKNQVDYDKIDLSPYAIIQNDEDTKALEQNVLHTAKLILEN